MASADCAENRASFDAVGTAFILAVGNQNHCFASGFLSQVISCRKNQASYSAVPSPVVPTLIDGVCHSSLAFREILHHLRELIELDDHCKISWVRMELMKAMAVSFSAGSTSRTLPLVSIRIARVSGSSFSFEKLTISCRFPSSSMMKSSLVRFGISRPLRSVTVHRTLTRLVPL